MKVADADVGKIVAFVTQDIEDAPALMMVIDESATRNGAQTDVQPILKATENYFLCSLFLLRLNMLRKSPY